MSEQHTPGPWRILADGFIYAKDGGRVADPAPWSPLHKARTDEEIRANTRLIEVAPELLEAAAFARDLAMRMTAKADIPYCAEFAAIAQELDAAIAKVIVAAA